MSQSITNNNSVKILCIGDPHIQLSNFQDVDIFLEKVLDLIKELSPSICVILGDVLHTHEKLHTLALNKAYDFIDKIRKTILTYVLVGNHDYIQNQQFLTTNHWMNAMKEWDNVFIVDKVMLKTLDNKKFLFVPYVPPGKFEEALKTFPIDYTQVDCIFCHQEFFGCKMGAITSVDGDKWPLEYPNIVSGHIHSRQTIQKNVYYTGSMLQHAFGESEKNIIAVLDFFENDKQYKLTEIDLELPRKKIVYLDVADVDEYSFPEDCKDNIKLTLSGNINDFKAIKKTKKYKNLIDKGAKIVFKQKRLEIDDNPIKQVDNNDENKQNACTDFKIVLNNIIESKHDSFLYQAYEYVVNDKIVDSDDVIYV